MNIIIKTIIFAIMIINVTAISCVGGRSSCISSCMIQNCATGYCVPREYDPHSICTCHRCAPGKAPFP